LNNDGKVDAADVVKMVDILNSADETPQQPENKVVTLTTTVGLSDGATGATTRALTDDGIRTFAEGDMMAVVYKNTSGNTVKAESVALTEDDIAEDGKSATFTVTLNAPDKTQDVTYIYPAAMAKADGSVNYDALLEQDGTLATLASQLDYCTNSGSWNADDLPSLTLENQLAICAYTLKNSTGSSEITNTIMGMTISDGTYNYTVSRSPVDAPIYVAIRPVTNADIEITATDGSTNYIKSLTGKTYAANNGYNISLKMQLTYPIALSNVTSPYIGSVITTDGNVYATVGDAATDGETAVAQIITVAHHLALALEDEGSMKWSEAISACSAKNGTSDAVTGASWRLPSVDDWEHMGVTDTNMTLGDLINGFASVGGVNMDASRETGGYWSSTDNGPEDEDDAWFFDFFTNIWYNYGKNIGRKVRACLDF
jgi:hypothetical protein